VKAGREVGDGVDLRRKPPKRALVVEFIGMPGSGKSTLMRGVLESLTIRGLPVRVVPKGKPMGWDKVRKRAGILRRLKATVRLGWFTFALAWRCPRLTGWYVRRRIAPIGTSQGNHRPGLSHFLNFGQRYRLFHDAAKHPGIHLSDRGGIIQTMAEVTRHAPKDDGHWLLKSKSGPRPLLLAVLVECDTGTIRERIRDRRGHPRARAHARDPATFSATVDRVDSWQRLAARFAQDGSLEDFDVLIIDNSSADQLEPVVAKIVAFTERRWAEASFGPSSGLSVPHGS